MAASDTHNHSSNNYTVTKYTLLSIFEITKTNITGKYAAIEKSRSS